MDAVTFVYEKSDVSKTVFETLFKVAPIKLERGACSTRIDKLNILEHKGPAYEAIVSSTKKRFISIFKAPHVHRWGVERNGPINNVIKGNNLFFPLEKNFVLVISARVEQSIYCFI